MRRNSADRVDRTPNAERGGFRLHSESNAKGVRRAADRLTTEVDRDFRRRCFCHVLVFSSTHAAYGP